MPLDSTDRRMLTILQREGRISNAALAERLHLSPSPCLRRLRALEHDGVVPGYRASPRSSETRARPDRVRRAEGRPPQRRERRGDLRRAARRPRGDLRAHRLRLRRFPAGDRVADLAAYERLLFDTLLKLPHVTDVRSEFALRAIKSDGSLPL